MIDTACTLAATEHSVSRSWTNTHGRVARCFAKVSLAVAEGLYIGLSGSRIRCCFRVAEQYLPIKPILHFAEGAVDVLHI